MKNPNPITDELESVLSNLLTRFAALPRSSSGRLSRGVPSELKRDIVSAWRTSGESRDAFARRFGVTGTSLGNWSCQGNKVTKSDTSQARIYVLNKQSKAPSFRRVKVVTEEAPAPISVAAKRDPVRESRAMCIELSSGARITGLGIEDVLALIQLQGGAR